MHSPQVMAALQSLSTATLQLEPVLGLQRQLIEQATGKPCHGQLTCSMKRQRLGRLRVDQQLYTLLPCGGVDVYAAPQGLALDAKVIVQTALSTSSSLPGAQQQQLQQQAAAAGGGAGGAGAAAATPAMGAGDAGAPAAVAAAAVAAGAEPPLLEVALAQKLSSSMRLGMSDQASRMRGPGELPRIPWQHGRQAAERAPHIGAMHALTCAGHVLTGCTPCARGTCVGPLQRCPHTCSPPQERAAKAAVQLPYAHQGAGRGYDYAGDARQYLPPAAGGYGPGVQAASSSKLGHILYVRDSDEEHDSDEDPDDDLDV